MVSQPIPVDIFGKDADNYGRAPPCLLLLAQHSAECDFNCYLNVHEFVALIDYPLEFPVHYFQAEILNVIIYVPTINAEGGGFKGSTGSSFAH